MISQFVQRICINLHHSYLFNSEHRLLPRLRGSSTQVAAEARAEGGLENGGCVQEVAPEAFEIIGDLCIANEEAVGSAGSEPTAKKA